MDTGVVDSIMSVHSLHSVGLAAHNNVYRAVMSGTKPTKSPARMDRSDVDSLRAAGFSDQDILHICEVTAYYAYANRIADRLGVQLEPAATDH